MINKMIPTLDRVVSFSIFSKFRVVISIPETCYARSDTIIRIDTLNFLICSSLFQEQHSHG